jgi:cold shock CspA family protein
MEYRGRILACYYSRGFGFIKPFYTQKDMPSALERDIFFHLSEYTGPGLQKDLMVSFRLGLNDRGPVAVEVKQLSKKPEKTLVFS